MLLCAFAADSMHFHAIALNAEPSRRALLKSDGADVFGRHIHYRLAAKANHVMVRRGIRFEPCRTMMRTDLADQSMLFERFQVFVHRGE